MMRLLKCEIQPFSFHLHLTLFAKSCVHQVHLYAVLHLRNVLHIELYLIFHFGFLLFKLSVILNNLHMNNWTPFFRIIPTNSKNLLCFTVSLSFLYSGSIVILSSVKTEISKVKQETVRRKLNVAKIG